MKKYDVYGIGNAIVDIVTEVEHDFFTKNEIEKGVMTLVDEKRQHHLMKAIDMQRSRMSGGGSAGNTVVAVNQFGGNSFYSCLVAKDELGKFFLEDLKRNGVDTNLTYENCPEGITGKCLVMTSPDAERTMNTFLGVSSFLSPEHVDVNAIKNSSYVYLEGYLVPSPKGLEALKEAKKIAEQNNDQGMINCCSGTPVKVKELVEEYLRLKKAAIKLNLGFYPYTDYEPMRFWGDNKRLKTILNNE